jgi:RecA/RadA recombinase
VLDTALRTGGWPCGALAMLEGPLGCGAASLALTSLAACQRSGGLAAWVDLDGSFDPAGAARAGVDLEWLLLVRPGDADEAVELAAGLVRSRLVDLVTLDLQQLGRRAAPRGVGRLTQLLARSEAVTLLLAGVPVHEAAVRVTLERRAWLAVGADLVGQRVAASVARHRWALPGGRAELDLWFGEGRRIDPLLPSLAEPREEVLPALRVLSA